MKLFLLERFFYWVGELLCMINCFLNVITLTLWMETNSINIIYGYIEWYNKLLLELEIKEMDRK